MSRQGQGRGRGFILRFFNKLLRVLVCQPVASSPREPKDGMRNLSTVASVPVQPQTPMQYRPADQSMLPSHGMGHGRGAQSVAASSSRVPTDAMRNISIGTSTPVASVPMQPQPPMQQIAKTTTQTSVVSLPLVPSSSKLVKPPARPGFGSVGKKIMITANHFLVQLGDKNPLQYDVTITPEVTSKTKCKHIMKCLIEQYKASHLGNHGVACNGNKSAFAVGPLPFENKESVIVVPEKDGRQHEFKVAAKFVVTKDIDLRQFLSGRQHDNPQETIQALDIVLREAASHERIIVGRSIFSTAFGMGLLGNGVDYCRGFYQNLSTTGMGISLNIDMSNAQQAETGHSVIEEKASRKSTRMLCGSHDLLDLLKSFEIGRQKEIQSLLEIGPVSNFAHRNRLPSLLRGRFLWNRRYVQVKMSTSVAASELGLLKQTHRVSDLRKGFLFRADSDDQIHDERQSDSSSNNGMGYHRENLQELPNDTVNEETHDEPQSDTSSNNGMNYHQENSQELPDIADESQTIITRNNDGGVEAEAWEEPIIGNTNTEWHHLTSPESNEGLDANSIENEDESYQGTVQSDNYDTADNWFGTDTRTAAFYTYDGDSSNSLELRELMSRRRVSNLLQSGFSLRLDHLLQSYVERQEQASQSDDEWMLEHEQQDLNLQSVFENDDVRAVQSAEGAHSSPPAILQHSGTEWEIINGLRIDMVRLQDQINSMQSTLETCMKMQQELRRSDQQEAPSALNRFSTSGEDSLETCFLCCDISSSDFSPDRCGRVHVCSNCAMKINWSKLKKVSGTRKAELKNIVFRVFRCYKGRCHP